MHPKMHGSRCYRCPFERTKFKCPYAEMDVAESVIVFEDDFLAEETKKDLEKYSKRNPKISYEYAHRCWRLVENIAASAMADWYQIAGIHGEGSPIMETITLNIETDYESKKNIAKYLAGIIKELDQSKELKSKPMPLKSEQKNGLNES